MNKKQAADIISQIARDNARAWLAQMTRNGELYYHDAGRGGTSHWFTLAIATYSPTKNRTALDFFWPSAVPQYSSDDPGEEARIIVGGYSAAMDIAAKAVGFSLKKRCFYTVGGGMEMVYACLDAFASRTGYTGSLDVTRTDMNRTERK